MELEFIVLELAGNMVEWLRNFLANISLGIKLTHSVSLHCDCQAAITITKNRIYNGKNRHIRLRYEVVKQLLKDGVISIDY
ncbi:Ty1/Copia family ribonuclease HI, partial [Mycobacterium kansasii]